MNGFANWVAMGGYGVYVWSAYALAVVILGFNVWSMRRARKLAYRHLRQWFEKIQ